MLSTLTPRHISLLEDLLALGVSFKVFPDKIVLGGFYKSNDVELTLRDPLNLEANCLFTATARYDEKTNIYTVQDLVELNYAWWRRSADRCDRWQAPDEEWVEALAHFKLITKEVKVSYIPNREE